MNDFLLYFRFLPEWQICCCFYLKRVTTIFMECKELRMWFGNDVEVVLCAGSILLSLLYNSQ